MRYELSQRLQLEDICTPSRYTLPPSFLALTVSLPYTKCVNAITLPNTDVSTVVLSYPRYTYTGRVPTSCWITCLLRYCPQSMVATLGRCMTTGVRNSFLIINLIITFMLSSSLSSSSSSTSSAFSSSLCSQH